MPHTDVNLGDCSFLDTCRHMKVLATTLCIMAERLFFNLGYLGGREKVFAGLDSWPRGRLARTSFVPLSKIIHAPFAACGSLLNRAV